jgi:BirA family biotin operon repressor/biotin-[acetyl-CoA-carboxylase] ligase
MTKKENSTPIYIHLPQTSSTNNYARELIEQNLAQHKMVISTHNQTQGKGQFGRSWVAEPNKNISLSILFLANEIQLQQPFLLLAKVALATRQTLQNVADKDFFIKWMNDIYCNDKKAAGILIETVNHKTKTKEKWVIVGVGINVNQTNFGELTAKATSLKLLVNKALDLKNIGEILVNKICEFWEVENQTYLIEQYNLYLYKKGHLVRFKKEAIAFEAIVKEVDSKGKLIVQNALWDNFAFGEVVWVI